MVARIDQPRVCSIRNFTAVEPKEKSYFIIHTVIIDDNYWIFYVLLENIFSNSLQVLQIVLLPVQPLTFVTMLTGYSTKAGIYIIENSIKFYLSRYLFLNYK